MGQVGTRHPEKGMRGKDRDAATDCPFFAHFVQTERLGIDKRQEENRFGNKLEKKWIVGMFAPIGTARAEENDRVSRALYISR